MMEDLTGVHGVVCRSYVEEEEEEEEEEWGVPGTID